MGRDTVLRSGSKSDDDMEKLITKVCSVFLNQFKEEFMSKIDKLDSTLNRVCESFNRLDLTVKKNTKDIAALQDRFDSLEQSSKRNSLRICGVAELENENLEEVLSDVFSNKLTISCSRSDITLCLSFKVK